MKRTIVTMIAAALTIGQAGAWAQGTDTSSSTAAPSTSGSSGGTAPGSPLQGLWTPPSSYQTNGQTVVPTPLPNNGDNPLRGLWTPPSQYQSGQTPAQEGPTGTSNHLQGAFTPPAAYQSGQSVQPTPANLSPEFVKYQYENKGYQPSDAEKSLVKNKFGDDFFDPDKGKPKKDDKAADKDKDKDAADADKDKDKDKNKDQTADKDKSGKSTKKKKKKPTEEAPPAKPLTYDPIQDALALLNVGRAAEALNTINAVLKTEPGNSKAHYVAAVILVTLRNYKAATDEYHAVIHLVPTSGLAQRAVDGLRKIGAPMPAPPKLPPLMGH